MSFKEIFLFFKLNCFQLARLAGRYENYLYL
jgi:hypothetical protein